MSLANKVNRPVSFSSKANVDVSFAGVAVTRRRRVKRWGLIIVCVNGSLWLSRLYDTGLTSLLTFFFTIEAGSQLASKRKDRTGPEIIVPEANFVGLRTGL